MDDAIICHGYESHSYVDRWKCDFCKQVEEEFDKIMKEDVSLAQLAEQLPDME